jgi:hypothetical protein
VRHAVECPLYRNGDLLFDFLGSVAGVECDDDDARIGDVGIGLDLELTKGPQTDHDECDPKNEGHQPMMKREGQHRTVCYCATNSIVPSVTTRSPAARPFVTTIMSSCFGPRDTSRRSNVPRPRSTKTLVCCAS